MPRIRNIKPEFWTDEKLVELGPWERLLFIGLWNFADDDGFLLYSPKRIKMQVFPAEDVDVVGALQTLTESSLITHYMCTEDSGTTHVMLITNWAKHQKVNRPIRSKYLGMKRREFTPEPRKQAELPTSRSSNSVSAHGGLTERSLPEGEGEGEGEGEVVLALGTRGSPARSQRNTALRIVGAWADAQNQRPPSDLVSDVTAQVQKLVNEGIPETQIAAGVAKWWEGDSYSAKNIPVHVARASQVKMATGTNRAMQTLELARQYEMEENSGEPF